MTPNPVPDQAPGINTQQGEQGRTEAERAAEERRIKKNQDNRQLNTVAPTAPAAPVINPEGINPSLSLSIPPMNDFYYRLSDYSLVVGYSVLDPTEKTNISM